MNKSIETFVKENLEEIFEHIKPSEAFEYFSNPANNHPFHIIVKYGDSELLGEYQNGILVDGSWLDKRLKVET